MIRLAVGVYIFYIIFSIALFEGSSYGFFVAAYCKVHNHAFEGFECKVASDTRGKGGGLCTIIHDNFFRATARGYSWKEGVHGFLRPKLGNKTTESPGQNLCNPPELLL